MNLATYLLLDAFNGNFDSAGGFSKPANVVNLQGSHLQALSSRTAELTRVEISYPSG